MRIALLARLFLLLIVPLPGVHAAVEMLDIAWSEQGSAALRTSVVASGVLEWCGPLQAGDDVYWEFDSGDTLAMNLHYHEAAAIAYLAPAADVTMRSGRIAVATAHVYCWMWTNPHNAPVALQVRLHRKRP